MQICGTGDFQSGRKEPIDLLQYKIYSFIYTKIFVCVLSCQHCTRHDDANISEDLGHKKSFSKVGNSSPLVGPKPTPLAS